MYIITFGMADTRIQWNYEFCFKTRKGAEQYLTDNKFIKSGLYFVREYDGWFPKTNATVTKIKNR